MNYKLELRTQESFSKIVFNNILFDSFKINIIERYMGRMNFNAKLIEVLIKVRTLDNQIIKKKDGNIRVRIIADEFTMYERLIKVLNSNDFKNESINRKNSEQDFVYFILKIVITNYELNSSLLKPA